VKEAEIVFASHTRASAVVLMPTAVYPHNALIYAYCNSRLYHKAIKHIDSIETGEDGGGVPPTDDSFAEIIAVLCNNNLATQALAMFESMQELNGSFAADVRYGDDGGSTEFVNASSDGGGRSKSLTWGKKHVYSSLFESLERADMIEEVDRIVTSASGKHDLKAIQTLFNSRKLRERESVYYDDDEDAEEEQDDESNVDEYNEEGEEAISRSSGSKDAKREQLSFSSENNIEFQLDLRGFDNFIRNAILRNAIREVRNDLLGVSGRVRGGEIGSIIIDSNEGVWNGSAPENSVDVLIKLLDETHEMKIIGTPMVIEGGNAIRMQVAI
jgi:hypothetical protein